MKRFLVVVFLVFGAATWACAVDYVVEEISDHPPTELSAEIRDELQEAAEVYHQIREDLDHLEGILETGRDKARQVSRQVVSRVRKRVGL